jgi:hypothetical protein
MRGEETKVRVRVTRSFVSDSSLRSDQKMKKQEKDCKTSGHDSASFSLFHLGLEFVKFNSVND